MQVPGPRIAIIGGGFTGAVCGFFLARAGIVDADIAIYEPAARLGSGLAYGSNEHAHRLNARAQKMSLLPEAPAHFCDWILASGACVDDAEAVLPDGRIFPRRAVYGDYVAAQLAPLQATGALRHVRKTVRAVMRDHGRWRVATGEMAGSCADIVILATGHAPPEPPAPLAGLGGSVHVIPNPYAPDALRDLGPDARLLIMGTGLTMADIAACLNARGHKGQIVAVSRRGQVPRAHARYDLPPFGDFLGEPSSTALASLRRVREAIAAAERLGICWQAVFDGLRRQAGDIWMAWPEAERRRFLRHSMPFWDVHRHRLPPQTSLALARRIAAGRLEIRAGRLVSAALKDGRIRLGLRARGADAIHEEIFDAVVMATGPGKILGQGGNPALRKLADAGWLRPGACGIALDCDRQSRAIGTAGDACATLLVAGPLARGTFGEVTSVPEIVAQAQAIAARIKKWSIPAMDPI